MRWIKNQFAQVNCPHLLRPTRAPGWIFQKIAALADAPSVISPQINIETENRQRAKLVHDQIGGPVHAACENEEHETATTQIASSNELVAVVWQQSGSFAGEIIQAVRYKT